MNARTAANFERSDLPSWRDYDNVTYADRSARKDLAELETNGLAGDTMLFFCSDPGQAMPRVKTWCLESSVRALFVIRFPGRYERLSPAEPGQIVDSVPVASLR